MQWPENSPKKKTSSKNNNNNASSLKRNSRNVRKRVRKLKYKNNVRPGVCIWNVNCWSRYRGRRHGQGRAAGTRRRRWRSPDIAHLLHSSGRTDKPTTGRTMRQVCRRSRSNIDHKLTCTHNYTYKCVYMYTEDLCMYLHLNYNNLLVIHYVTGLIVTRCGLRQGFTAKWVNTELK